MKITCISDTHTLHNQVTIDQTDILLYGGDFMNSGYKPQEAVDFLTWFNKQPANYRIMIAGNHDRFVENHPEDFKSLVKEFPEITYLQDEEVIVEGLKIYGTPHSKIFYNWAFNRSEQELESLFMNIPLDTDILLSHAPQYQVLDELIDGKSVGEFTLSKQIRKLKQLKLHVFGHIHNGFGMLKPHGSHISVNASQVNEYYDCVNFPIIIDL